MNRQSLIRAFDMLTEGSGGRSVPKKRYPSADSLRTQNRRWMSGEGIQGFGLARRVTAGQLQPERAIKVYVERKRPMAKIETPIPGQIELPDTGEKLPVDVEEIGKIALQAFRKRERPVFPGIALGHAMITKSGTFGCLVKKRDEPGNFYILSNAHVLTDAGCPAPGPIYQPGVELEGERKENIIADFIVGNSVPLQFTGVGFPNLSDATIAKIRSGVPLSSAIAHIGVPNAWSGVVLEGQTVQITGSASGNAVGKVKDPNFTTEVSYYACPGDQGFRPYQRAGFSRQVLCTPFTRVGDSGALVVNRKGKAVGLHFAGSESASVFNRIKYVLDALDIDIVTDVLGNGAATEAFGDAAGAPPYITADDLRFEIASVLIGPHIFRGSIPWHLTKDGLVVDGVLKGTGGDLITMPRIWDQFGQSIRRWAEKFKVPVELIMATICTESRGDPGAIRKEPGYLSDEDTPDRISAGLMQTLLETAQRTLRDFSIDRTWCVESDNSIQSGTAYIDSQRRQTLLDPPKVACAYNAGALIENQSPNNRWKMKQFPIGTGNHADRFVEWFNDCFRLFNCGGEVPEMSFYRQLRG